MFYGSKIPPPKGIQDGCGAQGQAQEASCNVLREPERQEKDCDTAIKSRGNLIRVNMLSEGQRTNRSTARRKRGQNDWAGSQIQTQEGL